MIMRRAMHGARVADVTGAACTLGFPVADRPAVAVVAADFVVSEDGPAARQVADDAPAGAVIGAGG